MIRNFIILAALIAAVSGYTFYSERSMPVPVSSIEKKQAPDFSFESLTGKKYRLADFSGKVVVLNFWASWCAPCVIEFPQMIALAKKTSEHAVFLFLSLDENKADVEKFLKKYRKDQNDANIIIGLDGSKKISQDLFQTYKLPETYIIAPDGTIAEKITGADILWDSPGMVSKVKELVK